VTASAPALQAHPRVQRRGTAHDLVKLTVGERERDRVVGLVRRCITVFCCTVSPKRALPAIVANEAFNETGPAVTPVTQS
jgi:hypothetical protein